MNEGWGWERKVRKMTIGSVVLLSERDGGT